MSININTKPVASAYDGPGERTIEYSTNRGEGGLISFKQDEDGHLIVDLYRHDKMVTIRVGEAS